MADLRVQNDSPTQSITVSIWSVDGEKKLIDGMSIQPLATKTVNVAAGMAKLEVSKNGSLFWAGHVPVGTHPFVIHPENGTATYNGNVVVNTTSKAGFPKWVAIVIALLIATAIYLTVV